MELCLQRCSHLVLSSTSALRRLRKLCYRSENRLSKKSQDLSRQTHLLRQMEESVAHLQERVQINDQIRNDLHETKEELQRKSKELKEALHKMNENYKLVAELSNENLKLTGEKLKAEEDLRRVMAESSRRSSHNHHRAANSDVENWQMRKCYSNIKI